MISKVFSGHSFYHACRYIVNKPGATVLECDGVRGHDYRIMSDDFIMQQQLRPEKEKACFHCALSFYPREVLSDTLMAEIAKEYLRKLNISNTQFAITKHTDRRHIHLHIVANLVDNNGRVISDSFLGLRGKKTAQQLTVQYNLVPAIRKNLEQTNYEALHKSERNKYKVYRAIVELLPKCKTMEDLEKKLLVQGIEMQYKYKGQTTEKQGVSFKIEHDSFKGSKVDRQFSLGNLEKTLAQNRQQANNLEEDSTHHPLLQAKKNKELTANTANDIQSEEKKISGESIVDILLTPEENVSQTAYELLKENKRKRKNQRRGLHH